MKLLTVSKKKVALGKDNLGTNSKKGGESFQGNS